MDLRERLLDLDETVNRLSSGISAVTLMSMGLDQTLEPYVDGFDVVCRYLGDTSRTLREQLDACLQAM